MLSEKQNRAPRIFIDDNRGDSDNDGDDCDSDGYGPGEGYYPDGGYGYAEGLAYADAWSTPLSCPTTKGRGPDTPTPHPTAKHTPTCLRFCIF